MELLSTKSVEVSSRLCILGIGNPLRSDDGVGWRVIECLRSERDFASATLVTAHQLLPEHAALAAEHGNLMVVDAAVDLPLGEVALQKVEKQNNYALPALIHDLNVPGLIQLALELYGVEANIWLCRVGCRNMELGEMLSPEIERVLPRMVEKIRECVGLFRSSAQR